MDKVEITVDFQHCQSEIAYYHWQRYYMIGFSALANTKISFVPRSRALFRFLEDLDIPWSGTLWEKFARSETRSEYVRGDHVGRYTISAGGKTYKVAIDGADGQHVRDPRAYDWADIYYKANKWEGKKYPEKVRPITSGEVTLRPKQIQQLRALRNQPKTTDLVFISRIWPGPQDNVFDVVEHNVRIFEALAKVAGRKDLQAIIPRGLAKNPEISPYLDRLSSAGVQSTDLISPHELIDRLAKGRTVFFRSGKHLALPGRMLWYLCMGACVVFDKTPYPQWYVPLCEGENFVSCDCGLDENEILPDTNDYSRIVNTTSELINNPEKIARIQTNNSAYFDSFAAPEKVAKYVLEQIADGPAASAG